MPHASCSRKQHATSDPIPDSVITPASARSHPAPGVPVQSLYPSALHKPIQSKVTPAPADLLLDCTVSYLAAAGPRNEAHLDSTIFPRYTENSHAKTRRSGRMRNRTRWTAMTPLTSCMLFTDQMTDRYIADRYRPAVKAINKLPGPTVRRPLDRARSELFLNIRRCRRLEVEVFTEERCMPVTPIPT